jgi:hypothetical protein
MRIFYDLTANDVAVVNAIARYVKEHQRTPKMWEVTGGKRYHCSPEHLPLRKAFERMVLLGMVEHSRNGHCHLTEKAEFALANG